jgi:hypothetical protein
MVALRPTSAAWLFAGTIPDLEDEQDHGVWWHFGRELTVISGAGMVDDVEWYHVSVSRWGADRTHPVTASDDECHYALEQFGVPEPWRQRPMKPGEVARHFFARVRAH